MMNKFRSSLLIVVWICLGFVLAPPPFNQPQEAVEKAPGPSLRPKDSFVSYEQLAGGGFEPDVKMTPVPEDYVRRELYRHRIFYEGFPVYFVEREGYNLQRMQRGFADFGKIYIAGPSLTGNPTLKIAKDAQGQPVTSEASTDVTEFAHDVLGARVSFGDTATLLAYGYKLDPAPYRKIGWFKVRPSPPDWEKVWSAIPRDRATDLRSARQLLSRQRFITFTTTDETGVLGIRLFHDGRQHIKWLVSESPFYSALH